MKPIFDWPALVDAARAGNVGGLVNSLRQLAAWHRAYQWPMTAEDYPPEVLAFLIDDAAPTGRPGRKPRSKFRQAAMRAAYEQIHATIAAFKRGRARLHLLDKRGRRFEPALYRANGRMATPADVAMEYLGHQNALSPDAIRDVLRKVKTTTKTD